MPIKKVGHPARGVARRDPSDGVFRDRLVVLRLHREEVLAHDAHVTSRVGARKALNGQPGGLDGLVHDLEQETLLRVHRLSFARRHGEEFGVKVAHVFGKEITTLAICRPVVAAIWVVESVQVEPSGLGDVGRDIAGVFEEVPEPGR